MDGQVVDVARYPAVIDALEWNALSPERLLVRAVRTSYGFMNRSSSPNTSIDDDGRTLRAIQAIVSGDELTLDFFRATGARGLPRERRGGRPPRLGLIRPHRRRHPGAGWPMGVSNPVDRRLVNGCGRLEQYAPRWSRGWLSAREGSR
jgi:hypothetical protein